MVIEIDGSWGEGGGQIVRTSVALSAILGKPITIFNIRAKRSPPGLAPQHVTTVKAVAQLTNAKVNDLKVGSTRLDFSPNISNCGELYFDTGTAASTSLILQSIIPIIAFSTKQVHVELRGGTNNPWAPTIDYLQEVLLPTIMNIGFKVSVKLIRRGFYPKGGGIVQAIINPIEKLNPLILKEFGGIRRIYGLSYSSRLPSNITEKMTKSANKTLQDYKCVAAIIQNESLQPSDNHCAISPGCGIILFAELSSGAIIVGDSLGDIGKPAEQVGFEAAKSLYEQILTCSPVDKHLGDQLIIYMGLANGCSEINVSQLTLHTITCIHILEKMIPIHFKVVGEKNKPTIITCEGIGLKRT